jgi:hypothetical protein
MKNSSQIMDRSHVLHCKNLIEKKERGVAAKP